MKRQLYFTKAHEAKREKLRAKLDDARDEVFREAVYTNIPFDECFAMASEATKKRYVDARAALNLFYEDAANEGRGYWNSWGSFEPNYR